MVFLCTIAEGAPLAETRLNFALAAPAMRSWVDFPLRQVLDQLGTLHHVSIFLDRHVDPGQKTSMNAMTLPLGQTLDELADTINTKTVRFGSILYLGPEETARLLKPLSTACGKDVRKMADRGRAMLTRKAMQWDDLATPRELLQSIAQETGVPIGPIESIPHDLWAGTELPSSTPVDRLTLILSQFDKTFSVSTDNSGRPRLLIVDIPEQIKQAAKTQKIGIASNTPYPKMPGTHRPGTPGTHGAASNIAQTRIQSFTVKQKQLSDVLAYLAQQFGLKLDVDRRKFSTQLQRRVNVTQKNVTVAEILQAVLKPVALQGEIDEQNRVLRVFEAGNSGGKRRTGMSGNLLD